MQLVSLQQSINLAMNCKISIIVLIVFSTILATTAYPRKCRRTSRKIYYVENNKFLNWDAASSACEAKGMHLVSIENKEELEYLKIYIKTIYGRIYPYWLGAYRKNGRYEWTATGKQIKNFFWHEGEPNDKSGNENCIHTWEEDFDWNDNDCELELPFICELEV